MTNPRMTFSQALQALKNNRKVIRENWSTKSNHYLHLVGETFYMVNDEGSAAIYHVDQTDLISEDWRIYPCDETLVHQRQMAFQNTPFFRRGYLPHERKALAKKAIDKWGHETQVNKLQEEMLELSLILNQRKCPTKDAIEMDAKLYSELADVRIMMLQADILFDEQRIEAVVDMKLARMEAKYFAK